MSAEAYELLALAMRYVFAFLMVLIVLRAWRLTAVDSARARKLRRLNPETGIIGEMMVLEGGEKARPGMRYPVTLEGTIGSAPRADIRLRHSSVRRRHAYYMMTDDGLFIRGHAGARIGSQGRWLREVTLEDGDEILFGRVRLLLVLSDGGGTPEEIGRRAARHRTDIAGRIPADSYAGEGSCADEYENDIFSIHEADEAAMDDEADDAMSGNGMDTDDMFFSNPASCLNPDDYDGYDDYDDPY